MTNFKKPESINEWFSSRDQSNALRAAKNTCAEVLYDNDLSGEQAVEVLQSLIKELETFKAEKCSD